MGAFLLFLGALLATPLILSGDTAGATPATELPWVIRSNLVALQFTQEIAIKNPEVGSALGYPDFDSLSVVVVDDMEADDEAFYKRWEKTTEQLLVGEIDPDLRIDLRILEDTLKRGAESIRLDRKYGEIPLYRPAQFVLTNLKILDQPRSPERLKSVPVRFKSYVQGREGVKPLVDAYLSRLRFLLAKYGKHRMLPDREDVEQYLAGSPGYLADIRKILEKTSGDGWKADFATFGDKIKNYENFLRTEILPNTKPRGPVPRDVYDFLLKSKTVNWSVEQLIRTGHAEYSRDKAEFNRVAKVVAKKLGLTDSSPTAVLRELKKKQIFKTKDVEAKFREARDWVTAVLQKSPKITIPAEPIPMRVMSEDETREEPYAHLNPPPLAFNEGERPEFVLPALAALPFPFDDFTYEAAVKVITAHEDVPGHGAYFETLIDHGVSIIRARYGYSVATVEGWAFYAEDMVYGDLPPESQLVATQMRLWRSARLFLDPELNLGRMKPEAAIRLLTEEVGLSPTLAEQEVSKSILEDPGQATAYSYGYLKILETKREIRGKLGKHWNEVCFNDGVLTLGLIPVDWLAGELARGLKCRLKAPAFGDFARR